MSFLWPCCWLLATTICLGFYRVMLELQILSGQNSTGKGPVSLGMSPAGGRGPAVDRSSSGYWRLNKHAPWLSLVLVATVQVGTAYSWQPPHNLAWHCQQPLFNWPWPGIISGQGIASHHTASHSSTNHQHVQHRQQPLCSWAWPGSGHHTTQPTFPWERLLRDGKELGETGGTTTDKGSLASEWEGEKEVAKGKGRIWRLSG